MHTGQGQARNGTEEESQNQQDNPGFLEKGLRIWKMPQKVKLRETTFQPSLSKDCLGQTWIQKRESFKLSFP